MIYIDDDDDGGCRHLISDFLILCAGKRRVGVSWEYYIVPLLHYHYIYTYQIQGHTR